MGRLIAVQVLPRLYIRGDLFGRSLSGKRALIRELNIDAVVCLTSTGDPDAHLIRELSHYAHHHMVDGPHIYHEALAQAVEDVIGWMRERKRVLVHCRGGRNRAGLVAALAIIEWTGCTPEQAIDQVRFVRPKALSNETFIEYITRYERRLES